MQISHPSRCSSAVISIAPALVVEYRMQWRQFGHGTARAARTGCGCHGRCIHRCNATAVQKILFTFTFTSTRAIRFRARRLDRYQVTGHFESCSRTLARHRGSSTGSGTIVHKDWARAVAMGRTCITDICRMHARCSREISY